MKRADLRPAARRQRGSVTAAGSATEWTGAVTFAQAYSSAPFMTITPISNVGGAGEGVFWQITSKSATGFTWRATWLGGASHTGAGSADWTAEL